MRTRLLALSLAVGLLAPGAGAGAAPTVTSPPTMTAPRPAADEVLDGVQATLDARAAAERNRDRDAFTATIDSRSQANTFRRIQQQWFDAGVAFGPYKAMTAKAMPNDYYKVWLRNGGNREAVWVFKQIDGRWLVTEPTEAELGKRIVMDTDHFRVRYFEWDADTIDTMVQTLERAYTRVSTLLDVTPDRKIAYLSPTFQTDPTLWEPFVLAVSIQGTIHLHSIESYGGGFYNPDLGAAETIYPTIVHEYTHAVNDDIVSLARLQTWMSEGLAEYAADSFRRGEVAAAAAGGRLLTLDQCHDTIYFRNEKGYSPGQVSLAYGESAFAVRWIADTKGIDTFWAFAKDFDKSRDLDATSRRVLGTSWEQTQADFLAWLKTQV